MKRLIKTNIKTMYMYSIKELCEIVIIMRKLKQCFLRKTMSPQPSSFVGYIKNYGIKLWRPFKQQYSMGRNGHRPKWLWAEMVID